MEKRIEIERKDLLKIIAFCVDKKIGAQIYPCRWLSGADITVYDEDYIALITKFPRLKGIKTETGIRGQHSFEFSVKEKVVTEKSTFVSQN